MDSVKFQCSVYRAFDAFLDSVGGCVYRKLVDSVGVVSIERLWKVSVLCLDE